MLILEVNDPKYFLLFEVTSTDTSPFHRFQQALLVSINAGWLFSRVRKVMVHWMSSREDSPIQAGHGGESDPDVKIDARNDGFFQKKGVGSFVKLYSFNI